MQEEQFSEKDSLKLISEMINKAKRSYVTKGIASIVWGSMIILCSLVTWYQIRYDWHPGFDVWLLLFFALLPQIFFSIKERRERNFVSHNENTVSYIWTAFAIGIFITGFYFSRTHGLDNSPIIMMLYGIPTFIMGGLFKFRPLIIGGLICWALSIVSLRTSQEVNMLLMAACGLFAWLLPGIILWRRYIKQRRANV